jgi:hypothetical protein
MKMECSHDHGRLASPKATWSVSRLETYGRATDPEEMQYAGRISCGKINLFSIKAFN